MYLLLILCSLLLAKTAGIRAEQLPVKQYVTADGLAHDHIEGIFRDSRGFLWFCTADGLSRFDGSQFTTYGTKDGLPSAYVNGMMESRSGAYWVATNGGLSRFNPYAGTQATNDSRSAPPARESTEAVSNTRRLFTAYRVSDDPVTNRVNTLYEDRAGQVWVGTDGGVFRLVMEGESVTFQRFALEPEPEQDRLVDVWQLVEDREGSLWIATGRGVYRRLPDGRIIHYTIHPTEGIDYVWALILDDQERLWIGSRTGLMIIKPEPASAIASAGEGKLRLVSGNRETMGAASQGERILLPETPGEARWYTTDDGLSYNYVRSFARSADGHIWMATRRGGVTEFDGKSFRSYGKAHGVIERADELAFDNDGNLWVGSNSEGAMRIARNGFLSYREADGLGSADMISGFESQSGELYFISDKWLINRFDGTGFTPVRPLLPKQVTESSAHSQIIIQDHTGEWWLATPAGLYRYPRVNRLEDLAQTKPLAVYTKGDGLADNNISRLFEDSRGDIWIGSYTPPLTLTRWERSTGAFHIYMEADGMPPLNWVYTFAEDASGNLWLGMHNGGLARFRQGRFEFFGEAEGVPAGLVMALYLDRAGRLWVATRENGAVRLDDPAATRPRFTRYSTAENLSSDNVQCFTEDRWGRIYIGTARGVDRLEPSTGRIKHYTSGDGLIRNEVYVAFADREGALWFGSHEGLSRLVPELDRPQPPPTILINRLFVDGIQRPISELGETELSGLVLEPNQNQIQIDFLSIDFSAGGAVRYQYMLEGADRDWSAPISQRTVNYATLRPGAYTFKVRALTSDGVMSERAAHLSFRILPPIWQRWWFLTLAALAIAVVIHFIYRFRVRRLIELERVRTRIATDLHDDIGASLSRMAILSEVVKLQKPADGEQSTAMLTEIADSARGLVDSMSDIVWSIDPRRDDLRNVVQRIRQFASDVLEAQNIEWDFRVPEELDGIRLGPEQRRHLYLIFKEAINNIARHADCHRVSLSIDVEARSLLCEIRDDGRGFAPKAPNEVTSNGRGGHGLPNMQSRARELGGRLEVDSNPGGGTRLKLTVPRKAGMKDEG
ncbi:MAG TPA: two-component regulator propeller domain-containing protein [Pyrinomonadaceae bacterium]